MLPMHLLLLLFSFAIVMQSVVRGASSLPHPGCPDKCGDVDIVYPFGIGPGCAMEEGFELHCNKSQDGHKNVTYFSKLPVVDISLLQGQVRMMSNIASTCHNHSTTYLLDFHGTPFTVSEKENMFTVIGANALAFMAGARHFLFMQYVIGCLTQSSPYKNLTAQEGLCTGVGCCQVALSSRLSYHNISFSDANASDENASGMDGERHCRYAMVVEADKFKFHTAYLNATNFWDEHKGEVPIILNWAVGDKTCDVAKKDTASYACRSSNSYCINSTSHPGYLCNCSEGYRGNPYLSGSGGCQDINECDLNPPPCPGYCINTQGSFFCQNTKNRSFSHSGTAIISVGLSVTVVMLVIAVTCSYLIRERRKLANIKERYFRQHGGLLLLEQISSGQGTTFTIFTEAELMEATDQFDDKNVLGRGGHGTVYKGTLKNGTAVAIKRCISMTDEQQRKEFGKEMLILSQVNHKNIVKLLGCCLEVEVPMLVYEFIPNGTLFQFIHGINGCRSTPFSTRIRIAHESALAMDYLHSCASPPILHGDVKSSNILLDDNYSAKVSDFGASIVAPTDESQFVTLVQGTCGYLDPEYMQTCQLTDKSDVYSFGVVLLELITGKKALSLQGPESERSLSMRFLCALKEGRLMDVIDDHIKGEENVGLLEEVADLARQCLEMAGENRPAMREVAERLDRLRKVMQHPWMQRNPEEVESLLGGREPSVAGVEMVSSTTFLTMEKRVGLLEFGR
ncbi:wall-associated receptor kinase 5 [Setaria viridis]|uniref:wall-associated receptor kinase 5 n=1 Tax=Setaria viridis TaxID=4556 RepID=UPI003B3BC778